MCCGRGPLSVRLIIVNSNITSQASQNTTGSKTDHRSTAPVTSHRLTVKRLQLKCFDVINSQKLNERLLFITASASHNYIKEEEMKTILGWRESTNF